VTQTKPQLNYPNQDKVRLTLLEARTKLTGEMRVTRVRASNRDKSTPLLHSVSLTLNYGVITVHPDGSYTYDAQPEAEGLTDQFEFYTTLSGWDTCYIQIQ
jgi:hypothetical protein